MMRKTHEVIISPMGIEVDSQNLELSNTGIKLLKEVYCTAIGNYPKFYKMDILSQLGFVASELLLMAEGKERFVACDDRATILFGRNSSICADIDYQETISNVEEFFPSPSLFVYTLPNIVTGEIALRNKYHGETSYMLVDNIMLAEEQIEIILQTSVHLKSALCGWIDAKSDDDFEAKIWIVEK